VANSSRALANRDPVRAVDLGSLPDPLLKLCNDAFARHGAGQFAEAIRLYEQILASRADLPDIHNNLGHALAALGRPAAASTSFAHALELKSDYPEALCNWGLALTDLERFDEAEAKYRQAIRTSPRFAGAYNNLGLLLKATGRLAQAGQAFQQAIDLSPQDFSFYDNLAAVRPFVAGDPYLTALETSAEDSAGLSITNQMHLHFGLAKAYDGLGRSENAFHHLLRANQLKRQQITYDEAGTLGQMNRLRELIGRDFIQARQGSDEDCGEPSAVPVFIVGMTRSGSTLIEQILASHPEVFGAGELPLFDQAAGTIQNLLPGAPAFPEMMLEMSPEHFEALGSLYLHGMMQRSLTATRISDKATVNFLFIGLIHLALPNAKVIHAVRDPADTCMSCFSTHFTSGQEHTYDLGELGRYYRHYRALMAHWHDVLPPGRIIDVHYEELVADVENVARRIISHCGLSWDPRCLDFHRTERPIRTASSTQVRTPMYGNSVERWRKYEAFLGPLLAEIAPISA
jgi:tetratricopeptide (TPR) repeat protein